MQKKTLAAAIVTAFLLALSPAHAATLTHLMQPTTGAHIVLVDRPLPGGSKVCNTLSFQDRAFFRLFPDGTLSPEPFEVPRELNLVITDVEWAAYGGPLGTSSLSPGNTLRLEIALSALTGNPRVFLSRGITLDADTATGRPGTSEQLTAGFVVGPGAPICPMATQASPSFLAVAYIERIILRGYLIQG
jgi:hypothetical protein